MKNVAIVLATVAVAMAFGACASKKKQAYQPVQPMQEVVIQK